MRNRKGFTLIELMVVIAIIGVLASIVLVSLSGTRTRARDTKRISDIRQIEMAMEMYYDDFAEYPLALADLGPAPGMGFLIKVPIDPQGGNYKYSYKTVSGKRTEAHLGALLENVNHSILDEDQDADSTGWTGGDKFNGASSDCAAGTAAERCYDVTP